MDLSSPESDPGSFECFQNYSASEVFVQGLAGQINQQDVESIIRAQKQMLQRFEKTNEMLSNCNSLSNSRFASAQKELKRHTNMLLDMKKDLDNIFKRIRILKTKMASQYPSAFASSQGFEEEGEVETVDTRDHSVVKLELQTQLQEEEVVHSSSCDSMSSSGNKISSGSSFDS